MDKEVPGVGIEALHDAIVGHVVVRVQPAEEDYLNIHWSSFYCVEHVVCYNYYMEETVLGILVGNYPVC